MLSYDLNFIFSLISVFQSADNYDSKLQQLRGDVNGAQCMYISLQKQFGYFTNQLVASIAFQIPILLNLCVEEYASLTFGVGMLTLFIMTSKLAMIHSLNVTTSHYKCIRADFISVVLHY